MNGGSSSIASTWFHLPKKAAGNLGSLIPDSDKHGNALRVVPPYSVSFETITAVFRGGS
jgi:hypothetical protein